MKDKIHHATVQQARHFIYHNSADSASNDLTMTASKRKNEDSSSLPGMTEMVIVDVINNNSNNNISVDNGDYSENDLKVSGTVERMKHLISQWRQDEDDFKRQVAGDGGMKDFLGGEEDDPIAYSIRTIGVNDKDPEEDMLRESQQIRSELDHQLQQEKNLCSLESSELSELGEKLTQCISQRSELLREIDELDERQRISQSNIATYVDEASQELEQIDEFEEERKLQVPRLKTTISLYASTTGIKWDFEEGTDVLSGQVVSFDSMLSCFCTTIIQPDFFFAFVH